MLEECYILRHEGFRGYIYIYIYIYIYTLHSISRRNNRRIQWKQLGGFPVEEGRKESWSMTVNVPWHTLWFWIMCLFYIIQNKVISKWWKSATQRWKQVEMTCITVHCVVAQPSKRKITWRDFKTVNFDCTGGDSCTKTWMNLMPQTCTLKNEMAMWKFHVVYILPL